MGQTEKKVRKLRVVRALVRPDRRQEYLERWATHAREVSALGARAWLFEDEGLPGRFVEFVEYAGAPGMEAQLRDVVARAGLAAACVRRTGAEERYREVRLEQG